MLIQSTHRCPALECTSKPGISQRVQVPARWGLARRPYSRPLFSLYFDTSELVNRIDHGHDVFYGSFGLEIVDRVENETAYRGENLAALQHLFTHLLGGAERQCSLRVHSSAPERYPLPVAVLEVLRIHARV